MHKLRDRDQGIVITLHGLGASGSTAHCNLARIMIEEMEGKVIFGFYGLYGNKLRLQDAAKHLIKTHKFHDRLGFFSDLVITNVRDVRDCIASEYRRIGRVRSIPRILDVKFPNYYKWAAHDNWAWEWKYEDWMADPFEHTAKFARILSEFFGWDRLPNYAEAVHDTLKMQYSPDDLNKLWEARRNSNHGAVGAYADFLRPSEIDAINDIAHDWLIEHGYSI